MFSKLSAWYRVLIVFSICWVIVALINIDPWTRYSIISGRRLGTHWDKFLIFGIMPIVLLWGIIWIVKGFRTKKKLKSKIDPEIKKKVKKFCKLAEDAGMELDKFLFDKGTKIGDVEAFINLQKQVQQEDRILGLDTLKKIKKLDEEKIFCASCGSVFIKKYGKVDSDGISICPDCYHKKIKS